jgi:hypothetical protein
MDASIRLARMGIVMACWCVGRVFAARITGGDTTPCVFAADVVAHHGFFDQAGTLVDKPQTNT